MSLKEKGRDAAAAERRKQRCDNGATETHRPHHDALLHLILLPKHAQYVTTMRSV
jgi:hypothetical protein